ncbi:ABC transporter permease [Dinghuibacter silviterrae]|uniref:Putative permease n=1 Tax=Dinghuibacter silviterrae TaxID=1539049 RepID=A0A4R8DQW8_9BACT|nr:ABC transporter permease [Dinghuibacter silviterrae]TDW99716.1 putative permease [Dinghuibacter silviterrae]
MWKTTFRSFWRRKTLTLLNISGLALGIAAALAIYLVITHELSFDAYHTKADRIYRMLTTDRSADGTRDVKASVPLPEPDALRREMPQIETVAPLWQLNDVQFTVGSDKKFRMSQDDGAFFAGPELFRLFDYTWLAGQPEAALKDPGTMAVSRSVAEKWFGHWEDAVGKTVLVGESHRPFKVTGVLDDPPANTDLPLHVVLSYEDFHSRNLDQMSDDKWGGLTSSSECYVLLRADQDPAGMPARLKAFGDRHFKAVNQSSGGHSAVEWQPLREVHFDEKAGNFGPGGHSRRDLWAMALIGVFLLGVACINFINLSTAYAVNRSREVGIRKVLGSSRYQFLTQFFRETAFLVLVALILACILTELSLPALRNLEQKPGLSFNWWKHPSILVFLALTGMTVTLLSGAYPGFVLSRFDPVEVIKNKINTQKVGGLSLRRTLVVLQFITAQLLIIGTLVVVRQMQFMREQPLGFSKDAIAMVNIPTTDSARARYRVLKDDILQIPGVRQASICDRPPVINGGWFTSVRLKGETKARDWSLGMRFGDVDYLQTFGMHLLAGRYPDNSDTLKEITLNETAVRLLGFKNAEEALGRTVTFGDGTPGRYYPIVGVVKEFHDRPIKDSIDAVMVAPLANRYGLVAVSLDPRHVQESLNKIKTAFETIYPDQAYTYQFLDEDIKGYYVAQDAAAHLFQVFSILAIIISCLGLYGLVSFMAVQKTKEVGIRKVLGASVQSIVYLFSREFTLLIGLAFVVAAPLGYYFMGRWLEAFYYRAPIGWSVFALAIVLSIVIAWATVGYRAIRAALADPVKALKYE